MTNQESYSVLFGHGIHQLSYRLLSTVHSCWKDRELPVRALLQGLFRRWGGLRFHLTEGSESTLQCKLAQKLVLVLTWGRDVHLWSQASRGGWCHQGPGAAHFPGKCVLGSLPEPPGVSSWALTPLTLKFPHLPANSRLWTPRNPRLLKAFVSSEVLVLYPGSKSWSFWGQQRCLQTHYESKWVFKCPRCCSFSPSATLISVNISYFFLVSSVSSASWQGLHAIHDKKFRMTWKSFGNG